MPVALIFVCRRKNRFCSGNLVVLKLRNREWQQNHGPMVTMVLLGAVEY